MDFKSLSLFSEFFQVRVLSQLTVFSLGTLGTVELPPGADTVLEVVDVVERIGVGVVELVGAELVEFVGVKVVEVARVVF